MATEETRSVNCKCGEPAYQMIVSRATPDAALELERVERPDGSPIPDDEPLSCQKCGSRINALRVDAPALVKTKGQVTPLAVAPSPKGKRRAKSK